MPNFAKKNNAKILRKIIMRKFRDRKLCEKRLKFREKIQSI